jgi:hypothetical protein
MEHRRKTGLGQVVDVALYESVFSVMESMLPEFDALGVVRERTGSILPGIAPTSAYRCNDGSYVLIAGNGDSIFRRLALAMGRADLARMQRSRTTTVVPRDRHGSMGKSRRGLRPARPPIVLAAMEAAQVPASKIYTVADIAADPHFAAREMIREIALGRRLEAQGAGIVPKLSATPGGFTAGGPALGQHTDAVLRSLGYDDQRIATLRKSALSRDAAGEHRRGQSAAAIRKTEVLAPSDAASAIDFEAGAGDERAPRRRRKKPPRLRCRKAATIAPEESTRRTARALGRILTMKSASIAVSPATGLMTLTRMLSFASSAAIDRLVTIAAPLLPLYQVSPGRGRTPAVDAIVMNTPFLCARKCGTTCRALRKRLFTLTW